MVLELPQLPESLAPRDAVFDGGKFEINYVAQSPDGIRLKTSGWEQLDEERAKKFGFDNWTDKYVYALRNVRQSMGEVVATVKNTTKGLYEKLHSLKNQEAVENLDLAMPVGGSVLLITTEADGSHLMVLQTRSEKEEYQNTLGLSAGSIIQMQFNDSGFPKPIEEVYPQHIANVLQREVGLEADKYDLKLVAFITEKIPKIHHEIVSLATSHESAEQIKKKYNGKSDLLFLPFEEEVITRLTSGLDSPIPPSHDGGLVSCGYVKVLTEKGIEAANKWMADQEPGVKANFQRIDNLVKASGVADGYLPELVPTKQGIPELFRSLMRSGLIKPYENGKLAETSQKFTPEDVCVVGSVMFKDYSQEGTPDNLRGHQSIDSLIKVAKMGGKAAIIVSPNTDPKFSEDLQAELAKLGEEKQRLIVLETELQRGYSASRRQAVNLARRSFPQIKVLIMQEVEKDLTEAYAGFLTQLAKNKILVMMNRGVNAPYAEYPWEEEDSFEPDKGHLGANLPGAQFWGERHQNLSMTGQEMAAFGETRYWDRLNGTRVILNKEVEIGGVKINPVDLTLLEWEYADGYDQSDRKNKMNAYSEAVYNMIPVLESLGGGEAIDQVLTKYWHSEKQREQEENDVNFRAKRLGHKVDLPRINFDVVCNILEWKKQGKWPQVLQEAIAGDKKLHIKHFTPEEWAIMDGEVVKREEPLMPPKDRLDETADLMRKYYGAVNPDAEQETRLLETMGGDVDGGKRMFEELQEVFQVGQDVDKEQMLMRLWEALGQAYRGQSGKPFGHEYHPVELHPNPSFRPQVLERSLRLLQKYFVKGKLYEVSKLIPTIIYGLDEVQRGVVNENIRGAQVY